MATCLPRSAAAPATRKAMVTRSASSRQVARLTTTFAASAISNTPLAVGWAKRSRAYTESLKDSSDSMIDMSDRPAKDALFDAIASVAQALGSGRRAEIVDGLAQGERSGDEGAGEIGQSPANTSHHLRLLARAGLVRSRRDGARVVYRLASDRVAELWAAV